MYVLPAEFAEHKVLLIHSTQSANAPLLLVGWTPVFAR